MFIRSSNRQVINITQTSSIQFRRRFGVSQIAGDLFTSCEMTAAMNFKGERGINFYV